MFTGQYHENIKASYVASYAADKIYWKYCGKANKWAIEYSNGYTRVHKMVWFLVIHVVFGWDL